MLNKKAVILHGLVWLILLFLLFFMNSRLGVYERVIFFFVFGFYNIIIFYVHYFFINPLFLVDSRYVRAILAVVTMLVVAVGVKYGTALCFEDTVLKYGPEKAETMNFATYAVNAVIVSLFIMLLSSSVYVVTHSYQSKEDRKTLENEKLNAELAFLKSQINPHFLFNSLNNIYSLAYQKSEKTPDAILKLSGIMRYMLYETNEDTVLLEEEVSYLENYIDLQRLRTKDEVYVDLQISIDREDYRVMPLLLMSFLENAFKHGVATNAEKPIRIVIAVQDGRLHFKTENLKSQLNKDQTRGVGLANLRRRLELRYPEKHSINIVETVDYYTSELFLYL